MHILIFLKIINGLSVDRVNAVKEIVRDYRDEKISIDEALDGLKSHSNGEEDEELFLKLKEIEEELKYEMQMGFIPFSFVEEGANTESEFLKR